MKLLGDSSVSSVISGILSAAWGLFAVTCVIISIGIIIALVFPSIVTVYDAPLPYMMEVEADDGGYQIEETKNWVKEPKLRTMVTVDFEGGNHQALLFKLGGIILLAFGMITLYYLRQFFKSLSKGHPFHEKNARRLKWIGWLTIAGVVVQILYNTVTHMAMKSAVTIKGAHMVTNWVLVLQDVMGNSLPQLCLGFVILVIAEVFRQGAAMKKEQDLTI